MTLAARVALFQQPDLAAIRASGEPLWQPEHHRFPASSSSLVAVSQGSTITPACAPAPASPARPRSGERRSFGTVGEAVTCSPSVAAAGACASRTGLLGSGSATLSARPPMPRGSVGSLRHLHRRSGMPLASGNCGFSRPAGIRRRARPRASGTLNKSYVFYFETMARSPTAGRSSERIWRKPGMGPRGAERASVSIENTGLPGQDIDLRVAPRTA